LICSRLARDFWKQASAHQFPGVPLDRGNMSSNRSVGATRSGIKRGDKAKLHSVSATLAWFAPTSPGRKSYRAVRLKLLEPDTLDSLRVKANSNQPDRNQTSRGTLFTRCWSGDRAPIIGANMSMPFALFDMRSVERGICAV